MFIRVRQAVRHLEEFSCSLADYFEDETEERGFSWNSSHAVWPGVADVEVSQQRDKRCSAFTLECFVVSISWFNARYGVNGNSFLFRAKLF